MGTLAQNSEAVSTALPVVTTILCAAAIVAGIVLWLLGRSLARLACGISGLVLGGLAGLLVGQALSEQGAMTIPLVIGGGIAGALLASLLFRVWMAISGAALLALVVPLLVFVWQGAPLPMVQPPADDEATTAEDGAESGTPIDVDGVIESVKTAVQEQVDKFSDNEGEGEGEAENATTAAGVDVESIQANAAQGAMDEVSEEAREAIDQAVGEVRAWWDGLEGSGRSLIIVAAIVGALIGLIFGLVAPYIAASFESALVGAILILLPTRTLLDAHAPDLGAYLPHSERATIVLLGLITLIGIAIQWTLFRRRTDK